MAEPYGVTIFCDDIRMEVGSKLTLVGCYSGSMTVQGGIPAQLPSLCAYVVLNIPISTEFDAVRLLLTKEEGDVKTELTTAEISGKQVRESSVGPKNPGADRHLSMLFTSKWTPFSISAKGFVRCRAYIDGKEVKLGSLEIKLQEKPRTAS